MFLARYWWQIPAALSRYANCFCILPRYRWKLFPFCPNRKVRLIPTDVGSVKNRYVGFGNRSSIFCENSPLNQSLPKSDSNRSPSSMEKCQSSASFAVSALGVLVCNCASSAKTSHNELISPASFNCSFRVGDFKFRKLWSRRTAFWILSLPVFTSLHCRQILKPSQTQWLPGISQISRNTV